MRAAPGLPESAQHQMGEILRLRLEKALKRSKGHRRRSSELKDLLFLRCRHCSGTEVITVLRVNERFSSNLPSVRTEMMRKLMAELPYSVQANEALCSAIPCGWLPEDPRQGPMPQDKVVCGMP